ncbi:low molecular weight phosphotyrosine protein phosphatase, partial [Sporormia fimetaria CBS 119925]
SHKTVSVLFVCLGNICRSTMCEAVFASLTTSHPLISTIDSCGTGAYHIGSPPDPRTMSTLRAHNITSYKHSARQFQTQDFSDFDYIFAMDEDNLEHLERLRKREVKKRGLSEEGVGKVMLFGVFGEKKGKRGEEVVDPYYGEDDGFERAFEQAVRFSRGFLGELEGGVL